MIMRREESAGETRWTIAALLAWTEDCFRRLEIPTPRLDAEVLLAAALSLTRIQLYTGYQMLVEPPERARFREMVARRARREPVAYICGRKEFYSLLFSVGPEVLIPRPETEHLVDCAIEELLRVVPQAVVPQTAVLDVGTGSGNIAVSVAVNVPGCRVDAIDASEKALVVARRNAEAHGVVGRVRFHRGEGLDALPPGAGPYALIVSNPPYVAAAEFDGLMDDVRLHEPREALVDESGPERDGLGHYRLLAGRAEALLAPGGLLAVEVGAGQAGKVVPIFSAAGWRHERTIRDHGGIERVVTVRR